MHLICVYVYKPLKSKGIIPTHNAMSQLFIKFYMQVLSEYKIM